MDGLTATETFQCDGKEYRRMLMDQYRLLRDDLIAVPWQKNGNSHIGHRSDLQLQDVAWLDC